MSRSTSLSSLARAALLCAALTACAAMGATAVQAQRGFPERPIHLIVPQAPGSATDLLARSVAAEAEGAIGQKIIIENKPGAAFTIGLDLVARAAPDGYTIGMGPVGALAISPNMIAKMPYDILRDFQPIVQLTRGHLLLAVSPKSSIHSVRELIAEAKKYPGKLTNASSASGSPGHVGGELFKVMAGVNIVHVPYRGGGPMISDLIGGQIHATVNGKSVLNQHIRSGKVRALGVAAAERWSNMKDVPTLIEAGYLDAPYDTIFGMVAPAGVPKPIVDKLNAVINAALRSDEMRASLDKIGIEPKITTPEEFAAMIAEEAPRWGEAVRLTGIKVQ
jgi:tripartite-type tricarboxylate transporter receptor subunit TctC